MQDPRGEGLGRIEADRLFAGSSDMARRMRAFDWSKTSIGPPERWPQSLRAAVRIMLTSRQPIWVGWGNELIYFYNDPYKSIIGGKDAWALGRPTAEVWREIWSDVGPLVNHVLTTGEATYNEGMLLFLERSGFPEETYHTFSYSPLFDDAGRIAGMFCAVVEETERVLGERRLATLGRLASSVAAVSTEEQLFDAARRCYSSATLRSAVEPFRAQYLAKEETPMRLALRLVAGLALAASLIWPPAATAGTITAYTALEEDDVKVYLEAFHKEVPDVKVNVLRLSTGDLIARILAAREFFVETEHSVAGTLSQPGAPFVMPASPWRHARAPLLGEHNAIVYGDVLGLGTRERARLAAAGVT